MLQVNPTNRPSAASLLKSLAGKMKELDCEVQTEPDHTNQLLQTIRADKKLHYLTDRLPQSNYQNGFDINREKSLKVNRTVKALHSSPKGVLPKIDRVVVKNTKNKYPVGYHPSIEDRRSI